MNINTCNLVSSTLFRKRSRFAYPLAIISFLLSHTKRQVRIAKLLIISALLLSFSTGAGAGQAKGETVEINALLAELVIDLQHYYVPIIPPGRSGVLATATIVTRVTAVSTEGFVPLPIPFIQSNFYLDDIGRMPISAFLDVRNGRTLKMTARCTLNLNSDDLDKLLANYDYFEIETRTEHMIASDDSNIPTEPSAWLGSGRSNPVARVKL